ncbi:MAG TPA: cysteine desulfurase [Candidatus Polarisedimenticolia bacterium]|nr:cysteine desulfurase [Candidatus Polarisedimenticolia bacterium]
MNGHPDVTRDAAAAGAPLAENAGGPRSAAALARDLDVPAIREDFPILRQTVRGGKPLAYLDNAATAQKPRAVIDAISRYYTQTNANVHRGLHELSERATAAYEGARATVRRTLGAAEDREIIFVRGTTEGINLVAQAWARPRLKPGDEILVSAMEHHSDIVPWQIVCGQTGARLVVAPITDGGELDLAALDKLLGPKTRLLALAHVSNALGTVNPVQRIVEMAHARKVPVLLDGAQAVPHLPVDVRAIGCDFYAFSGHKAYGPTGIGALYGRAELLEAMDPWQGGGDMIASVSFEKTTWNRLPWKFEAGTPDIAGAVGLAAALDYVASIGWAPIEAYESALLAEATETVAAVPGVRILAREAPRVSVISFTMEGVHPHDIGTIVDLQGVAIRAGHHCAQPLMDRFGVPATARASLAFYNTLEEIDALVQGLHQVNEVFGR